MNRQPIFSAIDVGSTKISTVICTKNNQNQIEVLGVGRAPSLGIKKGVVTNIEEVTKAIRFSVEEAQQMSGLKIKSAYLSLNGNHIKSFNACASLSLQNREVTSDDVAQMIESIREQKLELDKNIVHIIPSEFIVDSMDGVRDPVGMIAREIVAHLHIITGTKNFIQNLIKCSESAGVEPSNIVFNSLAASHSILTEEEKELGVVLIDMGGSTTNVIFWKNGGVVYSYVLPIGGNNFSQDLALGLKINFKDAENIKCQHGSVIEESSVNPTITFIDSTTGKEKQFPFQSITQILEARAEELLDLIKKILTSLGEKNYSCVLVGGGALMAGLPELTEYILERPVRLGYPLCFESLPKILQSPEYATVLGLIKEAEMRDAHTFIEDEEESKIETQESFSFKNIFKEIF